MTLVVNFFLNAKCVSLKTRSIVKSMYCRCRGRRRFHEKRSKRTYVSLHEQGAWKETRCAKGREGAEETRGRGTGETAGGHSPAASNRKGKTPGEHELVFGDIVVTCRWRKHDDNSDGIGVQLTLSLLKERKDTFPKNYMKEKKMQRYNCTIIK